MSTFPPYNYQQRVINTLLEECKVFQLIDCGLGKTACTLQAIEQLFNEFMINRVLIIAPLRVCKFTWPDEIKKWSFDLTYSLVLGTKQQRIEALKKDVQLYIINIENII